MSGIPTVPGSEIDVSTPAAGVHVSPGAFQSEQGRRAMGSAFGEIAGDANQLQGDLIKAHEAGVAANVDLKMRTARQSFLDSLRNDSNEGWRGPNDSNWKDRAAELSAQVKDDIFSSAEGITPEMKSRMESAFNSWSANLSIETQAAANVQMTNRAWGHTQQDYQEALKDDHAEHAMNLLENARRNKIADPALIDSLEQNIPRAVASNYINNGLAANPKGTLDLLRSGASLPAVDQYGKPIVPSKVFGTKEYDQLLNTARIRTAAWQKVNGENMLKDKVDPTTGFVPDDIIKQSMATGEVDEIFGTNLIKSQDSRARQMKKEESEALQKKDREAYMMLSAKVHDPISWGAEPDQYAHSMVTEAATISDPALRQKAISDVNRQLKAVKTTGETAERPVEKKMYEMMGQDLRTQGAMIPVDPETTPESTKRGGFLWMNKTTTPAQTVYHHVAGGLDALDKLKETGGEDPWPFPGMTKEQAVAAANLHAARLQNDMRDWFKSPEGQKATFEQANDHRMALEKPYVMDAVRSSLTSRAPAVITSREEFKALPPGAPFIFNGQTGYAP